MAVQIGNRNAMVADMRKVRFMGEGSHAAWPGALVGAWAWTPTAASRGRCPCTFGVRVRAWNSSLLACSNWCSGNILRLQSLARCDHAGASAAASARGTDGSVRRRAQRFGAQAQPPCRPGVQDRRVDCVA